MNKLILLFSMSCLVLSCSQSTDVYVSKDNPPTPGDSLSVKLREIQDENVLPGFAVSIFTKDSILYQEGFGYADINSEKPYSVKSVQIIASITKTLIGVALMRAVEDGKINLDDKVNDILPFSVSNPRFLQTPITIRHLATHTSSISSTSKSDKGYRFETPLRKEDFPEGHHPHLEYLNKVADISMADFLAYKLSRQGKWYEEGVFTPNQPGTSYEYSNLGAALLAHCIEISTGESFDEYTDKLILHPLEMASSTWTLAEVDRENQVTYYNEVLNEVPPYRIISYPDGGLYSSAADLTQYFQEMMKGYAGKGELLTTESYREMMTRQYDAEELTEGLCWDLAMGADLIGHAGNDYGTSTLAYFSPSSGVGRILFSNISIEKEEQEDAFYGIYNLLFQYDFN